MTELSPLTAFIFREGLVRFCGGLYNENQLEELQAHVSNNAVQTKTQRHASGQNWTLEQLWDHLRTHGAEGNKAWGKHVDEATQVGVFQDVFLQKGWRPFFSTPAGNLQFCIKLG